MRPEAHTIPAVSMDLAAATEIAQHVKAALLHLARAERAAEAAGIDLDRRPTSDSVPAADWIGTVFRDAYEAVEDLDSWAINNASTNGASRAIYAATDRWCHTREVMHGA